MFRTAANGNPKVGPQLLELIDRAESGRVVTALDMMQHALQYKEANGAIFEQREREGLPPPDIFPHPDDFIIDETTGEFTIDGPITKEQAGAQKAFREHALKSMLRYFEVEAALKEQPKSSALRREFKELKKCFEFLKNDAQRNFRREALRQSRLALETKPAEPNTANPGSEHGNQTE
jgi:hypothetical protein